MSFRAEDESAEQWNPARLKRNYPRALPVYSVYTEADANALITLTCSKGYESDRHGLPHLLREDIANLSEVAERLHEGYEHMKGRGKWMMQPNKNGIR